jgi:hypothetical protein
MTEPTPTHKDDVQALADYARRLEQERAATTDEDKRYDLGITLAVVRGHLLAAVRRRDRP